MRVLTALSISFSLVSCAGVERPDTDVCVANVPALHERCYNLKKDYDDQGNRRPDAKPKTIVYKDEAAMLAGLNKKTCVDPDGLANLKAYIDELRRQNGRKGD